MSTIVPQNFFQGPPKKGGKGSSNSSLASRYPVEFKAGKMNRVGTTVTADPRKGTVYLTKSDDQLLHFCWKDRKTGTVEDDLIIFPEEAQWLPVPQCTTGRVFVLKFKTSSQRLFYWMQDPSKDRDEEWQKKINDYINNPASMVMPSPTRRTATGGDGELMDEDVNDEELSALLANSGLSAQQQQLLQMLSANGMLGNRSGATGGSTTASTGTTATTAPRPRASSPQRQANATRLLSVLTPEMLAPVLSDSSLRQQLFPLLPEGQTPEEVVRSPQFQQAVQSLDEALQSGELAPLMRELGIDPLVATTNQDRVLALLRAIQQRNQTTGSDGDAMDES